MGMGTKISWAEATFNGVRGCVKVSPGCKFCYAEFDSHRNPAVLGYWGKDAPRVVGAEGYWHEPVKWNKDAMAAGVRKRVFAFSLADVFEQFDGPMVNHRGGRLFIGPNGGWLTQPEAADVGAKLLRPVTYDDCRERLLALISCTPALDWMLLTKRAADIMPTLRRVAKLADNEPSATGAVLAGTWADGTPPANVWMGVSAENEQQMWLRMEALRFVPAVVRWVSFEPLLEYVPIHPWVQPNFDEPVYDWGVIGGESGAKGEARMCHLNWIRQMVNEHQAAGIACFVKQMGSAPVIEAGTQNQLLLLNHPKGGDLEEFPCDLRIQEYPTPRAVTGRR